MSAPSSISSRRTTLTLGSRLMRDELHAEDLSAPAARTSSSDFATLTPPPLPRPPAWICALTTQTVPPSYFAAVDRLVDRKAGNAARRRDAVLAQDFLALVLVYVHVRFLYASHLVVPAQAGTQ